MEDNSGGDGGGLGRPSGRQREIPRRGRESHCDEQEKLMEIDVWSKEGHDSVDYRESFVLSKEVSQF